MDENPHQVRDQENSSDSLPMSFLEVPAASKLSADSSTDVVDIYLQQAEAYCDESQWDKAIAACQKALKIAPETAPAYRLLGNVLQRQGKLTDAMGFYAEALSLQPGSPEIYSNLGSLYARKQSWQQAIAYFQKAIDKDASFAIAYLNLAKVWKQLGKSDQELTCLQTALKLQPDLGSAQSHYRIGQSLEAAEKAEVAVTFYQQAIERSPDFLPAYERLVDLLENQGDWQAAVAYYRKIVELTAQNTANSAPTPDSAIGQKTSSLVNQPVANQRSINPSPAPLAKAKINLSKRDQRLVQNLLQSSSKKRLLQPTSAVPITPAQLGAHYTKAEDCPRAIQHLKQALQSNPKSAVLYRTIAALLVRNQQPQQAAMAWYRAFTLEPGWPNAKQYLQVGDALFEQDKLEAAMRCYQGAIRTQPAFSPAYHRLARLLNSQGSPDMAEAVLQRLATVDAAPQKGAIAPKTSQGANAQQQALKIHQQGETLQKQGEWEGAIAAYQKAIEFNSTFSWSHHNLGDCYKKIRHWSAAAAAYQVASKLKPEFVWSYYSQAEVAEAVEDWAAAARHYRQVLKLEAQNAQAPPRLVTALRQLITTDPRNTEYYQELAEQMAAQGDENGAISTYQMALQIRPDASQIALALSKLIAQKDPAEAHALIDRALSHTVTNQDIQSPSDLQEIETAAALLSATHLFDSQYYRATNPDLAIDSDRELLLHYLRQGSAEGRNPNPLFDDQFYRDRHPELAATGTHPLAHFHRFGHLAGDDPHPFFKTAFYRKMHTDVAAAEINPLEHYLAQGAKEGRVAFSAEPLAHLIEQPTPTDADYLQVWRAAGDGVDQRAIAPKQLAIYCSSLGNYFITEIADFIAAALEQAGHTVLQLNEQSAPPENLDGHWVVAPHEFFYLGDGPQWTQRQQWLPEAVMINVEQPQTTWFSSAFHFLRHAPAIFDINVKSTAIMQALKLPAYWLPLGYLPQYAAATATTQLPDLRALKGLPSHVSDHLPEMDAPLCDRPLDLHFIGTLNPRREQFFASSAQWLSQFHCFLHIPPMGVPLLKGQDQALDTEAVVGLSRRSKILLNIHRDELPYFEWHRMVFHGLWQNTLVVTEPCHDIPGLVAGEHFIECAIAKMADKIEWLLKNPEGQATAERIRQAGHRAIKEQFSGVRIATAALAIAEKALAPKNKGGQP
ncbi:MAG: hypothetical protein DCF25_15890 [Leptolyngbya foveolarum]|uniref:UDP-N-acetylglucosamine--peptide N-acetylglucosaminyltransferase SPINDLY n=1 Tax=Leptolyngbya foveolarum TaxID=47253 RepID=A0A2W4U2X7_9CYAN|nr:MAG: hypothetical protein DCF25_15890 [Leptolyngbya foveolarum]